MLDKQYVVTLVNFALAALLLIVALFILFAVRGIHPQNKTVVEKVMVAPTATPSATPKVLVPVTRTKLPLVK